jgi:hypothetical protein
LVVLVLEICISEASDRMWAPNSSSVTVILCSISTVAKLNPAYKFRYLPCILIIMSVSYTQGEIPSKKEEYPDLIPNREQQTKDWILTVGGKSGWTVTRTWPCGTLARLCFSRMTDGALVLGRVEHAAAELAHLSGTQNAPPRPPQRSSTSTPRVLRTLNSQVPAHPVMTDLVPQINQSYYIQRSNAPTPTP